ncbi:hypothetical protein DITRI_Ditri08aG0048600 [Diplodiscus trichospermus]
MANMLSPAVYIFVSATVLLNFASTSMPQTTLSGHHLPLSRFQQGTPSQPIVASSSKLPPKLTSPPITESRQLSSDSDKEKKEEKQMKNEEEEEEEEKKKKKKKKDCSQIVSSNQTLKFFAWFF